MEIYGYKHSFQNDKVKEKIKETFIEKFGCNPSQCEELKEKNKETCMKNNGCENPSQSKDKKIQTNLVLYIQ